MRKPVLVRLVQCGVFGMVAAMMPMAAALAVADTAKSDATKCSEGVAHVAWAGICFDPYSQVPEFLLLLLMIGGHVGFYVYLARRGSAGGRPKPATDRQIARQDDLRARGVDALLDNFLKKRGVDIFFVSIYVILILYLLAPLLADGGSLEELQYVAAALAPLLTVASIYFVVRQLRKNEEAIWSTTVEHVHARMHDIHRIFLEYPDLRRYFYENHSVPIAEAAAATAGDPCDGKEAGEVGVRAKIMIMAEMICDYFEQIILHQRHLPTNQARSGWDEFMVHLFKNSPALRGHLWGHPKMYPDELKELAEREVTTKLVREHDSDLLAKGHAALDAYFGERGEMEALDQLRARLRGNGVGGATEGAHRTDYEMMLVVDGGEIIAASDYCVIVPVDAKQPIIGFLSHLWVAPCRQKRGWGRRIHEGLEALVRKAGAGKGRRAILVAEAEPAVSGNQERLDRLAYFRKAGYLPVDPGKVGYLQPDFDPGEEGDASHPVPLLLLLRDYSAGERTRISGAELRHVVESLYAMYERSLPARHMRHVRAALQGYPAPSDMVGLSWEGVLPPAEGEGTPSG